MRYGVTNFHSTAAHTQTLEKIFLPSFRPWENSNSKQKNTKTFFEHSLAIPALLTLALPSLYITTTIRPSSPVSFTPRSIGISAFFSIYINYLPHQFVLKRSNVEILNIVLPIQNLSTKSCRFPRNFAAKPGVPAVPAYQYNINTAFELLPTFHLPSARYGGQGDHQAELSGEIWSLCCRHGCSPFSVRLA